MKKAISILLCLIIMLSCFSEITFTTTKAATSTNWSWPTDIHTIKSDWPTYSGGGYHGGTDFPVALNSPVYSTCDGEVVAVTSLTTSYGKHIKIRATVNGSTVYMRYCHLNSFSVSVGDKVSSGQLIGYSGSTGNSTGPHLHYEVRNANDYYGNASSPNLNPRYYLPGTSYYFESYETSNNPTGCIDLITGTDDGYIEISGWAFDRDDTSTQLGIHVYVGGPAGSGAPGYSYVANSYRPDVNDFYGVGEYHGYDIKIPVSSIGKKSVYVYAINIGGGNNVEIGNGEAYVGNLVCTCSTDYAGDYYVSTNSEPLTMRSGHNTEYSAVTYIPKDSKVYVSRADGNWAHVEWNGYSGYCSMSYLTRISSSDCNLHVWVSDTAMGDVPDNFVKGEGYYICYEITDASTGKLINDISNMNYTATETVRNSSGKVIEHSYTNSDYNWIWIKCDSEDTYTGTVTVSGDVEISCDISFDVYADTAPQINIWAWESADTDEISTMGVGDVAYCSYLVRDKYTQENLNDVTSYWTQGDGYTITIKIYDPSGSLIENRSYKNNDCTWFSFVPDKIGEYKIEATVTGNLSGSMEKTINAEEKEHKYGAWSITKESTCTQTGTKTRTCSTCHGIETQIVATIEHIYENVEVTKYATCEKTGIKTYTCSICGIQKEESISELGHTIVIDKAIEPTVTSDGLTEGKHCSVCGEIITEQKVIPATAVTPSPTQTSNPIEIIEPTVKPPVESTVVPTSEPIAEPTLEPTLLPTAAPTSEPTVMPTAEPTVEPAIEPTLKPTATTTAEPTLVTTIKPTMEPTVEPMVEPTLEPTKKPSVDLPSINNDSVDEEEEDIEIIEPKERLIKVSKVQISKTKIIGKLSVSKAIVKIKIGSSKWVNAGVKGKKFTFKSKKIKKNIKIQIKISKRGYKTLKKNYRTK